MNDDRISEVYKGEIWTDALQQRAQRRINWLCSQAEGNTVLDVGCSQGIASILLGREGFRVTGIDIQPSRIEYARADLKLESSDVQGRVKFEVANGSELNFEDGYFDTVILGEVIEHLAVPGRLLTEISRVLKADGVVVITTPFGLSPHHDHKQTFYPSRLWKLVGERFRIRSVAVVDSYFRIAAECPPPGGHASQQIDTLTVDMLDEVWATVDSDLRTNRLRVADLEKQNGMLSTQIDRQATKVTALNVQLRDQYEALGTSKKRTQDLQDRLGSREQHIAAQAEKIRYQSAKIEDQSAKIEDQSAKIEDQSAKIEDQSAKIANAAHRFSRTRARVRTTEQRILRLEDDRAKLRDRLALARWKLASTRARKWWRIGVAVGRVRSNILRVFVLPFDILQILFKRSSLPAKPQPTRIPPPVRSRRESSNTTELDSAPQPTAPRLVVPERPRMLPMTIAAPPTMSLAPPPTTTTKNLRVASILDEMSYQSFAPECQLVTFGPHNWLEVLERERPNLLLVESAWRGNSGSWEYKVGSYSYPESVGLPDLNAVVEWCHREGVPTVFWNKEDPVHFEKFKEAAAMFDVVLTTDANMVDHYSDLPGVADRVIGVLPFAAQPTIHNPVDAMKNRDPRPVFAGAYYRNRHQSRRSQLDLLLDAAMPFDLLIYDRMGGAVSESFGFPVRFQPSIEGTLAYEEMVRTYRAHRVFLNVNSVSDSPTMFSRRVFELLASGTPVVSTASIGVNEMFGGVVDIVETQSQANDAITRLIEDDDWWWDRSIRGIESVFRVNTYADRLHTIADAAGLSVRSAQPRVSVVIGPDSDLSASAIANSGNVAEILSLTDRTAISNTESSLPIRQIEVPPGGTSAAIASAVSRTANSEWVAFANSESDLQALRSLTTATRITPAEIYVPAPSSARGHEFVREIDSTAPALVSREFVGRTSWSPWHTAGGSPIGARVYSVPIING